ncbi:hypothetical protein Lupro_05105 [Lutibacter profundi]|uniref:Haemolysin activator HlyB C-terminal domain-containing protein n=1 Tax=Lutibacter profundi TaxID=1622118 RepID=A0A0X8G6R4_9FLAO|nr:hypothetical protein Lupro_05105 [Lutibacter profundi]
MYIHTLNFNDLKAIFKLLNFTLIFITSFTSVYTQNFELIIQPKDSTNTSVFKSMPYVKTHNTYKNMLEEINNISEKLAAKGYINNSYNLNRKKSTFICTYTLNSKINTIKIYYSNKFIDETILKNLTTNYTNFYFEIPINTVENSLNFIVDYFENKGASFTTASLSNFSQHEDKLIASLQLNISQERKINATVIKGYENFPKKYLNHYLDLKQNYPFSLNTLNKISELLNTIPFVTQLKNPEVLFTKDSTTLFIYLKKKATSKFDGVIGFSNKKNSNKINFNGYLDFYFGNIFNKGEYIALKWRNNGDDTQALDLKFELPYIFNTPFTIGSNFSIFKQDSTFVNTNLDLNINFSINRNNFVNAVLSNQSSNLTLPFNTSDEIKAFKKKFVGLSYTYKLSNQLQQFTANKLLINLGYSFGKKTIKNAKENQRVFQLHIEYIFNIDNKNSVLVRNNSEILNATNLLENELYRIGGTNSIRGFDEQSIFTSKYNISNIEYHYKLNQESYIYTISDIAFAKDDILNSNLKLYSFGLGYYFTTNNSILNLSYAVGKSNSTPFNFNNSRVHIKITYPF